MSTFSRRTSFPDLTSSGAAMAFVGAVGIRRVSAALAGRFTVLKQLAGTENAEFYQARPVSGGQGIVKIKVLAPRAACNLRKRELFRLECRAASKLDHPGTVKTSEVVEIDGINLCVIEHRPWAETLRDLLHRKGWLDLHHAARIINQIASAMSHAHRSGILHLRLFPENILIEPNGQVLITDFGIDAGEEMVWAHRERSQGLPASYMSVEQLLDKPVDHRTDIYALGLLLYEMMTDRVPFDSCDAGYLKRQRTTHTPLPPYILSTGVTPAVSDIIMQLLEGDPARRPCRVDSFQTALAEVLRAGARAAAPHNNLRMRAAR